MCRFKNLLYKVRASSYPGSTRIIIYIIQSYSEDLFGAFLKGEKQENVIIGSEEQRAYLVFTSRPFIIFFLIDSLCIKRLYLLLVKSYIDFIGDSHLVTTANENM